jgi:hypothetical protein
MITDSIMISPPPRPTDPLPTGRQAGPTEGMAVRLALPLGDCVVTVSKGERQSGSKALVCGSTASSLFQNVGFFILRHTHLREKERVGGNSTKCNNT